MFTGTVPNITQILITSNLLTVKFAEVFCWTISDVTLLKSTIMISIPRFQNEKKKSPINDYEDYNKFWNSNRFTLLQKQNLAIKSACMAILYKCR